VRKIEIFFIKSLDDNFLKKAKESFFNTISNNKKQFEIRELVDEDNVVGRSAVLNKVLEQRDQNKDLLIVSDDIIFTEGWSDNLLENINNGDIIGFSMAKPYKKELSNRGFYLVEIGKKITYEPNSKGKTSLFTNEKGYISCDAITGCCMFIKKEVLKKDIFFRSEGSNRWEELIFALEAKVKGFKVICLNHVLWHYGISTKNKNLKLSSISYLIEKKLWDTVLRKYGNIMNTVVKKKVKVVVEDAIKDILKEDVNILIVGAGTVTDYILENCDFRKITIVSGLLEEKNLLVHGIRVKYLKDVVKKGFTEYKYVIFAAIGYEKKLLDEFNIKFKGIFVFLQKNITNNEIRFSLKKFLSHKTHKR